LGNNVLVVIIKNQGTYHFSREYLMRVITGDDAKTIIRLLKDKRPMRIGDFKKALSLREFEIKKLLIELVAEGVVIREDLSGEEKFWLNESVAVGYLERNPLQKKRMKRGKEKY
jgi:transcription initiation factor IIE alpha subunit